MIMQYDEWVNYRSTRDVNFPLATLFETNEHDLFYIEPAFYTALQDLRVQIALDSYLNIIANINDLVKKHHRVVFTIDFTKPIVQKDDYIYIELSDITNRLRIFWEDKSRGSDYGD
jgi:hypothetical protein